ncbi:MAG: COX15/CtaA family protein [Rhodothalassiaceae bacterium]
MTTYAPTAVGVPDAQARRLCAIWLFAVAGLVALMVVVGGITRLTESGLSIIYWKPVTGILPPLSQEAWQAEFALYRTSPEYLIVNQGMSLAEFKTIYWWEYGHRLLGRLIGLAFAVPLALFALTRRIPAGYGPRFVGLLLLGGLQGAMGWYMVQSGLVDVPEVSHYRLTAHFLLALAIFAALMWTAFELTGWRRHAVPGARRWALALLALLGVQLALGALVAGLKAGYIYSTWPLMDGGLWPRALLDYQPWWRNLADNPATVQFLHRMTGYALVITGALAALRLRTRAARGLAALVIAQMSLGIATLVTYVPVPLGAAHQFGGVAVLAATLWFLWRDGARA